MEPEIAFIDSFWNTALDDEEKSRKVIRLFYSRTIKPSAIRSETIHEVMDELPIFFTVLKILMKTDCAEIIRILQPEYTPFNIAPADICQFSNFEDCYYKVIDRAIRSNLEVISYDRMGFLLRTEPRSVIADKKYGENHGKTAVQMGLMDLDKKHQFRHTTLGVCFNHLSKDEKKALMPKMCLYIPMMQNYFVCGMDDSLLESYFQQLSLSTQRRRRSNVMHIINIIKSAL